VSAVDRSPVEAGRVAELVRRVPASVRVEVNEHLAVLTALAPPVLAALQRLPLLDDAARAAMQAPGDACAADPAWHAASERLGLDAAWAIAEELASYHPDRILGGAQ
jgi:hypothetical protein